MVLSRAFKSDYNPLAGWNPKVNGITVYGLSPYEQKVFPGALTKTIPKILRRTKQSWYTFVPRKYYL